ncbi:hypothetical protein MUK42_20872 [Musa troglodytarum]|uniref:Uncharacterized protein n=1 Tax=Musa troglodytarum TaxID=320322 RepID=A0A9E7EM68_9LILI|nr:hypothetical protein MUK42_20872 [Musa troglodytarum]
MLGAVDDDIETLIGAQRRFEGADAAGSRASLRWLRPVNRVRWARRSVGERRCWEALRCRGDGCAIGTRWGRRRRVRPSRHVANSICRMDESPAARMSAAAAAAAGNEEATAAGNEEVAEGSALADFRSMEEELTAVRMESRNQEILRRMESLITTVEYHQASRRLEEFMQQMNEFVWKNCAGRNLNLLKRHSSGVILVAGADVLRLSDSLIFVMI